MAERSFTDRLQRGLEMHDIIAGFIPAYAPGAPAGAELDLRLPAFHAKLTATELLNNAADDAALLYSQTATDRENHLDTVLTAATSVLAYLRSKKKTLGTLLRGAETVVKRMRGARPKKKNTPLPEGEVPPAPERNRGQQSYMEQAGHLRTLINLLTGKPGYAPPVGHLAHLDHLNALLSSLRGYNTTICQQDADLIHAESERYDGYFEKHTGLHDHFQAMKESVKGIYGAASSQYGDIAGKTW
jgi:hypothetical protein